MHKYLFLISLFCISTHIVNAQGSSSVEQTGRSLPSVDIQTMTGDKFNTSAISNSGKPIIINFWATYCKPCIKELSIISELYEDWQNETGVKIIAIATDDSRTVASVLPFVNGMNWDFEVYTDPNGDFKRAMSVNVIPYTFILNSNLEIVWQHISYSEGDELQYIEIVKKIINKEKITE